MTRGYAAIGLLRPKTASNVGCVLRAARVYGASMVAIAGARYSRSATDTTQAWRHMPVLHCADLKTQLPLGCIGVAVELVPGARPLPRYTHPERAFYVFGPEDGSVGPRALDWCRDVIYIPGNGCSNLAMASNTVLYDRMVKSGGTWEDYR